MAWSYNSYKYPCGAQDFVRNEVSDLYFKCSLTCLASSQTEKSNQSKANEAGRRSQKRQEAERRRKKWTERREKKLGM